MVRPATLDTTGTSRSGRGSDRELEAALPVGVIELARNRWRAAERLAEAAGIVPPLLDDDALIGRLRRELTAPLRLEDWPAPVEPRAVTGGWIHVEVLDDERPALDALLVDLADSDPETVARSAQWMRLPVTPYRNLADRPVIDDDPAPVGPAPTDRGRRNSSRPIVVDLSTHWAGPLATALLAEAGAEVIKIDPSCRPDGFRARPALYRHLNGHKQILDLDLRVDADRKRFEDLLGHATVLVESFSRRVLPNLGYDRAALARLNPGLATVSVKAFPATAPEADWLAYGPGVHAASGLAIEGGRASAVPIAYPDLIAGVSASACAVSLIAVGGGHGEVSLAGAIAPLVRQAIDRGRSEDSDRG